MDNINWTKITIIISATRMWMRARVCVCVLVPIYFNRPKVYFVKEFPF